MKRRVLYIIFFLQAGWTQAQDPHFSQFFMAPLLVNPANSGTGGGDWRFMANWRSQWKNAGTPFVTLTATGDIKLIGKEEGENTLGAGITFMSDQSMNGAFKSTYVSGSLSYHQQLGTNSRLGLGLQGTFGNRRIDYSQLTFGEQFTNGGFDISLPTGETALANMKPYFSAAVGILYSYNSEKINFGIGGAGFHVNKPQQTFVQDPEQVIPIRYVGHANFEYAFSKFVLLHINTIYQRQSTTRYFATGGSLGLDISNGERRNILFAGGWWRQRDAIYPYLGLLFGSVQLGFTYDVTTSKQKKWIQDPQSFEFSLLIKQSGKIPGVIPCPGR